MPSLIYITRVRPFPADLAQGLESAGFHVRCFGPGEVTADECLLVMTSEAILTGLEVSALAPLSQGQAATRAESEVPPGIAHPKDQSKDKNNNNKDTLGPEAAIWHAIKTPATIPAPAGRRRQAVPPIEPEAVDLGFMPSLAGTRELVAAQQKAAGIKQTTPAILNNSSEARGGAAAPRLPIAAPERAISEREQAAAVTARQVAAAEKTHTPPGRPSMQFWLPAGAIATLAILAIVLLAGRASTIPAVARATADETTSQETASHGADSVPRVSSVRSRPRSEPSSLQGSPVKEPNVKATNNVHEIRQRISEYDFVAEDYTTHYDRHGHRRTAPQAPATNHGVQSQLIQKRVVVN